jgi:hypothetical protein
MRTALRLSRSRASGPTNSPRGSGSPPIRRTAAFGRRTPFNSSGERLLARRIRPLVAPAVALVGCGPPGPHRVLREVLGVARTRAGGMAARRAEDGIPQATSAHHALAGLGRAWVLHVRSALLTRPARHPRSRNRPISGPPCDSRPTIPLARPSSSSPCAADWSRYAVLPPDAGTTRESLIPTASATRGPRPSGRWFAIHMQAVCQERPGGDARAAWHPLILEGTAAAGQSVDQPGPGPLVSWRWQTPSNGSSSRMIGRAGKSGSLP